MFDKSPQYPERSAPHFVLAVVFYQLAAVALVMYFSSIETQTGYFSETTESSVGWLVVALLLGLVGLVALCIGIYRFANSIDFIAWRSHVDMETRR